MPLKKILKLFLVGFSSGNDSITIYQVEGRFEATDDSAED